jgi:hypothetical protein
MEEGNWIDMTGIPLIATKGIIKEEGAGGGGAEAGHGDEAEQGAKAEHDEGVEHTTPSEKNRASDVDHVAVTEHGVPTTDASPGADATNTEGAAHVSTEQMEEVAHGSTGGNADDETHTTELEAALLAASSPDHEANASADPAEADPVSAIATAAEV